MIVAYWLCFGLDVCGIPAAAMDGGKRRSIAAVDWEREYRQQQRYYGYFMKKYDALMQERQLYKRQAYRLEAELRELRPQEYRQQQRINRLAERIEKLEADNARLRKQLAAINKPLDTQTRPASAFIKPNVAQKAKKRPGRKTGHAAAQRPIPGTVD